jgi:hypothetical protein
MHNGWNTKDLNAGFRAHAESLDRRLSELLVKKRGSFAYELEYDVALAEFYVYNYLRDRTLLETRATFCAEIQTLLRTEPPTPLEANPERFLDYYKRTLERLRDAYCEGAQ